MTWWSLSIVFAPVAADFRLPAAFEGTWQGVPYASVVGPWSENFTFSISKLDTDYLFEANLPFDASPEFRPYWSWQRSYLQVSGEDEGRLLHCPGPRNPRLKRVAMMQAHSPSEKEVTFCLKKWSGYKDFEHPFPFRSLDCYTSGSLEGCGCFNWTLRMDGAGDALDYQVSMSGSPDHEHSRHLWATLHRIPFMPSLDLVFPGKGRDFTCDYASRDEHQTPLASCPFAQSYVKPHRLSSFSEGNFQHCYKLDMKTEFVLEWDIDSQNSALHVQISASSQLAEYVSIGFRPLGGSSSKLARDAGTGWGLSRWMPFVESCHVTCYTSCIHRKLQVPGLERSFFNEANA